MGINQSESDFCEPCCAKLVFQKIFLSSLLGKLPRFHRNGGLFVVFSPLVSIENIDKITFKRFGVDTLNHLNKISVFGFVSKIGYGHAPG
jgi:hypothetical protein